MPAHKGVEPSTRLWVLQVYQKQQVTPFKDSVTGATMAWYLKVKILPTEAAYLAYKAALQTSKDTGIAADYGVQNWRNKKSYIVAQFDDVYVNGNFIPNFNP